MRTNQDMINAVYAAAAALGMEGWSLLEKAALTHLVRDRHGEYAGPVVTDLVGLSEEEKAALSVALQPPPAPQTSKALHGKGMFIWVIGRCEGGDPARIASEAVKAGLTHVLIKIAQGPRPFRDNITVANDKVGPLAAALRAASDEMQVWGWQYTTGEAPEAEAQVAVDLTQQYALDGFVINAEVEYKREGGAARAARYSQSLRQSLQQANLAALPVGLSSYRYPAFHGDFPWAAFLPVCTLMMPQVYWVSKANPDPVANLTQCLKQYANLGWTGPLVPTGAAYDEWQFPSGEPKWLWSATADEIRAFLPAVRTAGLPAVNFWSWQHAGVARWQAIAEFQW